MTENIVDKTFIVTSVTIITELATGDLVYQVTLGSCIKNTPEILNRIPSNSRESFLGTKNIAVNEISLLLKVDEVPYKVGSKWKMKIHKNGTLNMVEAK
jgi:hypothetical protein